MTEAIKTRRVRLMKETVAHSTHHVKAGGIPFTALVMDRDGTVLGRGTNTVRAMNDPTAHAEVEAIRDACRTKRTPYLPGAVLLASGEPCAMCYMNALHAGIAEVHYAVDRHEAAEMGFDYRDTYKLFAQDPQTWQRPFVGRLEVPGARAPFEEFHALRPRRGQT